MRWISPLPPKLKRTERAHDLLRGPDLGRAIVFSWPLWRIEVEGIDRAMFEIEVNGAFPVLPAVNDVER